jgi:hypothetical protein
MPKFILSHGIHRGTITRRDSGAPEEFETREAAIQKLAEHEAWYKRLGYVIWFAVLQHPDGKQEQLGGDENYR